MYAALCCLIDFNATRAHQGGEPPARQPAYNLPSDTQANPSPCQCTPCSAPALLCSSGVYKLAFSFALPATAPLASSILPFPISISVFNCKESTAEKSEAVGAGRARWRGRQMAFIELYKFLHIDSDCLFTQTHVPHSLCLCVCDLVFCFAKVYRICMALRDWEGEGMWAGVK